MVLSEGTERTTALGLVRAELAQDFPTSEPRALERELALELGTSLETWLERDFFALHCKRLARRPVVWQLQSKARRGRKPAFSCWLDAHALDADSLPKLSSHWLTPLRQRLVAQLDASGPMPEPREPELVRRLAELDALDAKLRHVQAEGFCFPGLAAELAREPLDRCCAARAEGLPPDGLEGFVEQEGRYCPLRADGVRVNLAPLQRAGLLARAVLAAEDVETAIFARATWRAQARLACRAGTLAALPWWEVERAAPRARAQ